MQLGPQTMRSICPIEALKCDNWKNAYIALTQLHMDSLHSNFTKRYSVAPGKLWNCENPLKVESKMADNANIL